MKTTFSDLQNPNCEIKRYSVHAQGLDRPSSIIIYFYCPWCGDEIKAYVWSLCGGGKRCECGAIFGGCGQGYKLKDKE